MKKLLKPDDLPVDVFDACISRIRDQELKTRLQRCRGEIESQSEVYDEKAEDTLLHEIESEESVSNLVSIEEMKKVYANRMAKKLAPGRVYYDKIMSIPEYGRCPLCNQRTVTTLDHYLPKSEFPALAVSPLNLVAACQDCNKTKSDVVPDSSEQETLHPYYDDVEGFNWIEARIDSREPLSFVFYVKDLQGHDAVLIERLKHHFATFKLNDLYSSHASEEVANIEFVCKKLFDSNGGDSVRSFLLESAESRQMVNLNSWQSVLYSCLAESDWYCFEKFN